MCGIDSRFELYDAPFALPAIACAGQKIVHLIGLIRAQIQHFQIELDVSPVRLIRIGVDHGENYIFAV